MELEQVGKICEHYYYGNQCKNKCWPKIRQLDGPDISPRKLPYKFNCYRKTFRKCLFIFKLNPNFFSEEELEKSLEADENRRKKFQKKNIFFRGRARKIAENRWKLMKFDKSYGRN